jgi:hypothetical protein
MNDPKITWRFEHSNLWFTSNPTNFLKHVAKGTRDLEIHPDTKIIYSDDISKFLAARFFRGGDRTNSVQVKPVPTPTPKVEPTQTVLVSGVLDPMDSVDSVPTPLPIPTPTCTSHGRNLGPGL